MSAAPYIQVRTQYRQQRRESPAREAAPNPAPARRRARSANTIEFVVAQVALGLVLAAGAYGFSSLLGNASAELARQETVDASHRARRAEIDIVRLRDSIDRLGNAEVVGEWARARGFNPSYGEGAHPNATL